MALVVLVLLMLHCTIVPFLHGQLRHHCPLLLVLGFTSDTYCQFMILLENSLT